ncbi:MAG TPA: hypothetical protein VLI04_03280 [Nocardioidaceae bacterium]|nr:hypothetical protein [Nocardioidaceae bacterium]
MSKMDGLRAMREARYEAMQAGAPKGNARPSAAAGPAPSRTQTPDAIGAPEPATPLCGHKAISGRTCTRDRGHSAKSHRYS